MALMKHRLFAKSRLFMTSRPWMKQALLGVLSSIGIAGLTHAHHSTANFDFTKRVTVQGVVSYFSFTNPHSFIDINVANDGKPAQPYKIFATSKVVLLRYGWNNGSVKPGDQITIEGSPDRNNPHELYMLKVTFADGSVWSRDEVSQ
jgi:hypothetical protein